MTKKPIYLKSGDAFIIQQNDSVEIVQADGNSCIVRLLNEGNTEVELTKRPLTEVAEIAKRYEVYPKVYNVVDEYVTTTLCNISKFHTLGNDELAERVALNQSAKIIRI